MLDGETGSGAPVQAPFPPPAAVVDDAAMDGSSDGSDTDSDGPECMEHLADDIAVARIFDSEGVEAALDFLLSYPQVSINTSVHSVFLRLSQVAFTPREPSRLQFLADVMASRPRASRIVGDLEPYRRGARHCRASCTRCLSRSTWSQAPCDLKAHQCLRTTHTRSKFLCKILPDHHCPRPPPPATPPALLTDS